MGARKGERRNICENRRARHDYELEGHTEAGLMLMGSEVKSLRRGEAHLQDAWVGFENGKPFLMKAHIAPYQQATHLCHEPDRPRPLLLHWQECARLRQAVKEKGLTLVPLRLYFDGPWAKLEFAVGKGRKHHDKRDSLRELEDRKEIARAMNRG
ncbi:MAG: SsrA-binding protein SmpB [Myxococcales bacterium]|nr:SsrA-binding protein SmpB [Myxococcales bacterium]